MQDKYIGPNKIVGATELDWKTPGGDEVVKIMFENSDLTPAIFPKKVFERLVQDVPMDYTSFREFRYRHFLETLSACFLEENVTFGDIPYLLKELSNKLSAGVDRGTSFLWFGEDKRWIPGMEVLGDVTFLEIEKVLKTIPQKDVGTSENKG